AARLYQSLNNMLSNRIDYFNRRSADSLISPTSRKGLYGFFGNERRTTIRYPISKVQRMQNPSYQFQTPTQLTSKLATHPAKAPRRMDV
ncbi:MAG: hypothetical protein WAT29_07595, partial [Thiolinea sp.]